MIFVTPRCSCRPTHTHTYTRTAHTHTHTHTNIHIQRISDEVLVQLDNLVPTPKRKNDSRGVRDACTAPTKYTRMYAVMQMVGGGLVISHRPWPGTSHAPAIGAATRRL